jgi:DNA-binding beta-propeller fold protein YncE
LLYRGLGKPMAGPGCGVALIDTTTGSVARLRSPCSPQENAVGLALGREESGLTIYLATWSSAGEVDGQWRPARGRILAVDAASGSVVRTYQLAGPPSLLILAPAAGRAGRRLYAAASSHGGMGTDTGAAERWQLVGLDPTTLDLEVVAPLDGRPRAAAIGPDGDYAYLLAGPESLPSRVVRVHLASGASHLLATVPGSGHAGLAVTASRVYVPTSTGNEVSVVDRRSGRLLPSIPVGRGPVGIALAPP